jgi:hypothetical protein
VEPERDEEGGDDAVGELAYHLIEVAAIRL